MIYWFPSIVWMGIIFYLSSRTGGQLQSLFPFLDSFNWGHFVAYFILGILVYFALDKTTKFQYISIIALIICVIYGVSDEFHQSFVPNRTPDIFDLINDTLGGTLGILGYLWWKKRKYK